ncbi:MAG: archease [Nanoarchaeota archaeon]|nr:archease [Nanoarchaeota archaeon]|tara:strand:- start:1257 stop:1670 length:414 start_codon:yes stop_codon:yes gene_type:complete
MKKYKFIDHTADVMFEAYGNNLNKLFENAALAVFEVQCDLKKVKRVVKRKIKLKNDDNEKLLFDFLEELIYLKDAKYLVFSKFSVKIKDNQLEAVIEGEKINPDKHELKVDVKAVTLHHFSLKKTKNGWKAIVILDI